MTTIDEPRVDSPVRHIRDLPGPPGLPVLGNALAGRARNACTGRPSNGRASTARYTGSASPRASSS